MKKNDDTTSRRAFIKLGSVGGIAATISTLLNTHDQFSEASADKNDKVKLMSPDGKIVEVERSQLNPVIPDVPPEVRRADPNKKFVMVIDLSKCKHAGKCKTACSKMHYLPQEKSYLHINEMKDSDSASPYWMPTPCFHCDNPPCVKVCPVSATFKLDDGIVGIDNNRCIGCRFCIAACPYGARTFNWSADPDALTEKEKKEIAPHHACSSHIMGTVEKCDFCPSHAKKGKLPDCVTACPNGVFYFGNEQDDTVTNGDETLRFSSLLKEKAAYRYLEHLGTKPRVYYLPPVNRAFPFKESDRNID